MVGDGSARLQERVARRDHHFRINLRHVAALAFAAQRRTVTGVFAVEPFVVGGLFNEVKALSNLTAWGDGFGDQGVASGAKLRFTHVLAIHRLETNEVGHRSTKNGIFVFTPSEWTKNGVFNKGEVARKTCSESLRSLLVARRTRHAVEAQTVVNGFVKGVQGSWIFEVVIKVTRWRVARGAFVFDQTCMGRINSRFVGDLGTPPRVF